MSDLPKINCRKTIQGTEIHGPHEHTFSMKGTAALRSWCAGFEGPVREQVEVKGADTLLGLTESFREARS